MGKLSNDLRRQVIRLIEQPFENVNKSLLMSLHEEVFNSNLCRTCKNEQILAYIELTRLIHSKNTMKEVVTPPSKKYRVNPRYQNVVVHLPKGKGRVSAETLTDAQAEYMLAKGSWDDQKLIVTVSEAESIRKEMVKEAEKPIEDVETPKEEEKTKAPKKPRKSRAKKSS